MKKRLLALVMSVVMMLGLAQTQVFATPSEQEVIINSILSATDYTDSWYSADYILAKTSNGGSITDDEKTKFLSNVIDAESQTYPGSLAKIVMGLAALGIDAQEVPKADGSLRDMVSDIYMCDTSDIAYWEYSAPYQLPYVLMFMDSGVYSEPAGALLTRENVIDGILAGLYSGMWTDIDAIGFIFPAFAPYYNASGDVNGISVSKCNDITTAIDNTIEYIKTIENSNGTFDNWDGEESSDSTAMAVMAISSVGEDVCDSEFTKADGNIMDGLLSFKTLDNRFGSTDSSTFNQFSTSSGLMALVTYVNSQSIYDLSYPSVSVLDIEDWPIEIPESGGSSSSEDVAYVSVRTTDSYRISGHEVYIQNGITTALDALETALDDMSMSYVENSGYISEIDGLGEFDEGPNSGWLYSVNGVTPSSTGADEYRLNTGDDLLWYYSATGVLEGSSVASGGSKSGTNYEISEELISDTYEYLEGLTPDEWIALGLILNGEDKDGSYIKGLLDTFTAYVEEENGVLSENKYTEYSKAVLLLTELDKDPSNFCGFNLIKPLGDFDKTVYQGINGAAWALIALDSAGYDVPNNSDAKTQATRNMYIERILKNEISGGGFAISGSSIEVDTTAMVLQALSKYRDLSDVDEAIERALSKLSELQKNDGSFNDSSESISQTIIALSALGIDMEDERFVKEGYTLLDALMQYKMSDGSFKHSLSDTKGNQIATEQAFLALTALLKMENGESDIYSIMEKPAFPDIYGIKAREAIEYLAKEGVVSGIDGKFLPYSDMTRAEFATIIVNFMGYTPALTDAFDDVSDDAWYAGYIGAAYNNNIIAGNGNGVFDPEGSITLEAAAAIVSRCDIDFDDVDGLYDTSGFSDWAKSGIPIIANSDISDGNAINPKDKILRWQMAQILYSVSDR
ncbi:MAG: S-layer homology domain-containing protein [Lachnospiraceae bacterium]|nr:S-layer homology domain-containing protein [Lachnospiraceae bacterium]